MIERADIHTLAEIAARAMNASWSDYARGYIAEEDGLTQAIATRMRDAAGAFASSRGHRFGMRALQSSAGRFGISEETQYGADFLVTMTVGTGKQRLCYGWVAQAKVRNKMNSTAWRKLQEQCQAMERELPGNGWAVLYGQRTKVLSGCRPP